MVFVVDSWKDRDYCDRGRCDDDQDPFVAYYDDELDDEYHDDE